MPSITQNDPIGLIDRYSKLRPPQFGEWSHLDRVVRLRCTPASEYDLRDHAALSPAFTRRPTRDLRCLPENHASGWSSTRCKNILLLFTPKSPGIDSARLTADKGVYGHRHERAVRCDGRRWRDRRTRRMRTAKSCGSDVAVLALHPGEAKLFGYNGGKRAVLRGELPEVSRKAIAQGRPECSRCPVCSCAVFVCANRTRDRGCSKHPVFPAAS